MAGLKLSVSGMTPEEMKTYLQSDPRYKRGMKLFAVFLVSKGWTSRSLEDLFEVSFKQITTWVHEVNERGIEGIEERPKTGRTPRLSEENKTELKKILMSESPVSFGIDEPYWKGEAVGVLIEQKFGVSYKKAQVYNIVKTLGLENINGTWVEKIS